MFVKRIYSVFRAHIFFHFGMTVLNPHPLTPINNLNNPTCPTAPMHSYHTNAGRHLSTPLLPSASDFWNQNYFLPLRSHVVSDNHHRQNFQHSHTFTSHYPQPQFNPPVHPFYVQQQPYDHCYFAQQPQYQYCPYPPPPHHPTVTMGTVDAVNLLPLLPVPSAAPPTTTKTLPAIGHIPLLSGRSDFSAWNNGVRSLIRHLGYTGHIVNPPAPGITPRPDRIPTYPPFLTDTPTAAELAISRIWWDEDNIVSHILTSRLSASVLSIIPFDDDDESLVPRTARTIYELLRQFYSINNHISSSALYSELCNLQCGERVLEYVTEWRAGITQLRTAKFIVSFHMVIEHFLDRLPSTIPYDILRFRAMENIDNVSVDDITAFIKLTDEVLKIDNNYRRISNTRSTSAHAVNPVPYAMASSLPLSSPTVATISQPRSSLVCSNCNAIGHTVDKCFKAGGGLEGKRGQYLASRTRIQAHLAHLTEILEGNIVDEPDPLASPISSDTYEPDIIFEPEVPPSPVAALPFIPTAVPHTKWSVSHPVVSLHASSSPPSAGLSYSHHSALTSQNLLSHTPYSQSTQGPRAMLAVAMPWTFMKDDDASSFLPDDVALPPVHDKSKNTDKSFSTTTSVFTTNPTTNLWSSDNTSGRLNQEEEERGCK